MSVIHACISPVLANNRELLWKRMLTSLMSGCSLKFDTFARATQLSFEGKPLEICEAQLNIGQSCERTSREGLLSDKKRRALADIDRKVSCKEPWTFPGSEINDEPFTKKEINDERKRYVEAERRRKIGLANKGKTPWNKGRKHKAETRELIRKRTTEALRDPKVKKKMLESPRFHSDQSKARISIALRKRWAERLKIKSVREKCYLIWASSIAEAARAGGHDHDELEWNSYEELKASIVSEHLQWKTDKLKRKEVIKLKMLRAAERRAAKQAQLEQERKEKEEKARVMEMKRATKKLEDETQMSLNRLKMKAKLSKLVVPVREAGTGNESDAKKWDLEFVKKERTRREISLADQIQALKSRQATFQSDEFPSSSCEVAREKCNG